MAYPYILRDLDDVYVEFSVSPEPGTALAPGESFTVTGRWRYPGATTYGLQAQIGMNLTAYGFLAQPLALGTFSCGAVSSGSLKSFTLTCTVPESAANLSAGERSFAPYLSFSIFTDADHTASGSVCADESCRLHLLTHRLPPEIAAVRFGDATAAKARFGSLVQGFSRPEVTLQIATDPLDPSLGIVERSLTLGGRTFGLSGDTEILSAPASSGEVPWSLSVTDSAGLRTQASGTVTVLPWQPPRVDAFRVSRYCGDVDDAGAAVYYESDDGEQVWITLSAEVAPVNGLNAWSAQLTVNDGASDRSLTLQSGADGAAISLSQDRGACTLAVSAARDHVFTLRIADWFASAEYSCEVPRAESRFNVEENGVAVGMYSGGTPLDKRFEVASDYTARFYGGVQGMNIYHSGEEKTGGKWVDGKNIYRHVLIATSTVDGGSGTVGTLPADFETILSTHGVLRDSVGSGNYRPLPFVYYGSSAWSVSYYIKENGEIVLQAGSEYNGTKQLVIITEYTKLSDADYEPGWARAATRPLAAMTSRNSQGCVVSASSEYSSSYAAWKAFNKNYADAYSWASADNMDDQWLQIKLDVALRDIVVTLYNRTRSSNVAGVINAEILGSSDGSNWTEIGVIQGRDGSTSALKTVHECTNHETAYQYIRLLVHKTETRGVCVGEMYIDGVQAV